MSALEAGWNLKSIRWIKWDESGLKSGIWHWATLLSVNPCLPVMLLPNQVFPKLPERYSKGLSIFLQGWLQKRCWYLPYLQLEPKSARDTFFLTKFTFKTILTTFLLVSVHCLIVRWSGSFKGQTTTTEITLRNLDVCKAWGLIIFPSVKLIKLPFCYLVAQFFFSLWFRLNFFFFVK